MNMANKKKLVSEKATVVTPEFRASFPALFEARAVKQGDPAKFSVQMLFQVKETAKSKAEGTKVVDIAPLKELVRNVLVEMYGADRAKWPTNLVLPFRDGGEVGKKDLAGYGDGIIFSTATSKNKPGVVYPHAGTDGRPEVMNVPSDFYGGCYARAKVNAYHWEYMGKVGVSLGLINVQKLRDGEMFGIRGDAPKDFDAIAAPAGTPAGAAAGASDMGV